MKVLQEAVEVVAQGLPKQFLAVLIAEKLRKQGVKLTKRERELLTKRLPLGSSGTFHLRRGSSRRKRRVQIKFTNRDAARAEKKFERFVQTQLPNLVVATAARHSKKILDHLRRTWPAESRRQKRLHAGFSKRLYTRWAAPIEGLRMLLAISREFGASVNNEIREAGSGNRRHLIEVLTRSHARACQITEEVICLLTAGYADGAMARWRALHEVAVVSSFIAAGGEDVAERYVLHQVVESKRAADEHERYRVRLGYKSLGKKRLERLEMSLSDLKARFGADFAKPYGWAANRLQMRNPKFADIERAAGIDHLRPYYRMASHPTHANPKGIFFRLALPNEARIFLVGPSNAGLADPGQSTALSLTQVSSTLGTLQANLDNIVALEIMMQLVREVAEAFVRKQEQLKRDGERFGSWVQPC